MSGSAPGAVGAAVVALVAALVSGHPVVALAAAPSLLGLALALGRAAPSGWRVRVRLEPDRVLVGDEVRVHVEAHPPEGPAAGRRGAQAPWAARLEVRVEGAEPDLLSHLVVLPPEGGDVVASAVVRPARRGHVAVRGARVVLTTPTGRVAVARATSLPRSVPVVPWRRAPDVEVALRSARTAAGVHRSRAAGGGDDLRGVREARRGDDLRRVDWRATRRTGRLMLAERTAERGGDVVLLLATGEASADGLEDSAAVAAGLVHHLVGRGDRVRLAEAGGRLRTSPPLRGRDGQLLAAAWLADVRTTPRVRRAALPPDHPSLPAGSACVLLGSVLDEAAVALLVELADRGHATLVRDGDAPLAESLPRGEDAVAARLADVRRALAADRLRRRGTTVLLRPLLPQRAHDAPGAPGRASTASGRST
ncbi:DUF58 domain-containing protein [Pseudokineococcus sp. 5B2Z-1]|uniref:DUF58 domain-containing protein n=1 Tax=Pseudokineococcus sp. 5B2Z-1 TaxID=3132744 RepID=UPI0030ABE56C